VAQYAWSNVLVAFDFDGTLAPIVARPGAAKMRLQTRARLLGVAKRYPCVVISGRSQGDVQRRVAGLPLAAVVGNHGMEPTLDVKTYAGRVAGWIPILERRIAGLDGLVLEDKVYSVAIHYRKSRAKRAALEALRAAVADIGDGVRWIGGKQVVNLVPQDAPDKSAALQRLRADVGVDTAIYLGDDLTDETVFAQREHGRLLAVRVGRSGSSSAPYYLRSQLEIDRFLDLMITLRTTRQSHRHEGP
jgi:trehalose 6-phosphate phosphatase